MNTLALLLPLLLLPGPKWTLEQARDLRVAAQNLRDGIDLAKDGSRFEQCCAYTLQGVFDACEQAGSFFITDPARVDGILDDALRCYNMVATARGEKARTNASPAPEPIAKRKAREAKDVEREIARIDKEMAMRKRLIAEAHKHIESLNGYIERRRNAGGRGPSHISEALGQIKHWQQEVIKHTDRLAEISLRREGLRPRQ